MPNILKISKEEISWQLGGCSINAGPQANARVKEYLDKDAVFFAPMSVTGNGYIWMSPESGWTPLSEADGSQKDSVKKEVAQLRQRVLGKLNSNSKLAKSLLSLPSDEGKYIFFKDENGQLRILLAGWGFANSRKAVISSGKVVKPKLSISTAKLAFAISGEIQTSYEFLIITVGGTQKKCFTGADGYYFLGEQKVGTLLQISDPLSGKKFTVEIEDNREEYILDVTRTLHIIVAVEKDEKPLSEASVSIDYHGKSYEKKTDHQGLVSISAPFFANENITANYDGQNISSLAMFPTTKLEFKLSSPVVLPPPPPEEKKNVVIRVIDQFGNICSNYPIDVEVDNLRNDFLTNENGIVLFKDVKVGTLISVKDGFSSVSPFLYTVGVGENEINYIIEKEVVHLINSLQMIGENNTPYSNRKVVLRQGDKSLILALDGEGKTAFNADAFENEKEINAQILSKDQQMEVIPFMTYPQEREYVIEVKSITNKPWWIVLVNILLIILLIIGMAWLGAYFVSHLPFE